MTLRRMSEERPWQPDCIHLDSPTGDDRTLCGYAYEGSCLPDEHDLGAKPADPRRADHVAINCPDCRTVPPFWTPK